jgi:large subunit ribosomal protein L31
MKPSIHPQYHQAEVHCACGTTFTIGSTAESIRVEVCSNCHPFYTGTQNIVDTAGQVERFQRRMERASR